MPPIRPVQECMEEYKVRLEEAVIRQYYMRDPGVKAVLLLSGGLDSSIIASIVAKDAKYRGLARIQTRCCGLKDKDGTILSPDVLEARKVAAMWDTEHTEHLYTIDEVFPELRNVIQALQTCYTTAIRAAMCMYMMCRDFKKEGIKMVMTGSGADEIFAGYLYFHKCPSWIKMQSELAMKITGLYLSDNLRESSIFGAFGLECRPPFLDRSPLDYAMNEIHPMHKMCGDFVGGRIEKAFLRRFGNMTFQSPYMHVRKCSSVTESRHCSSTHCEARQKKRTLMKISNKPLPSWINTPKTHEMLMYRDIFNELFPHPSSIDTVPENGVTIACSTPEALKWCDEFQKTPDDSGRSIVVTSGSSSSTSPISSTSSTSSTSSSSTSSTSSSISI